MATPVTDTTIEATAPGTPARAGSRRMRSKPDAAPAGDGAQRGITGTPSDDASPLDHSASTANDNTVGITIAPSVEAILLSVDRPVTPSKIAEAIAPSSPARPSGTLAPPERTPGSATIDGAAVRAAVEHLNAAYAREGRSFRIEPVSGGLRVMTRPEHADVLARFHGQRAQTRLSRAALESLAIIAYRQPITRAEIESIRGVASGEILKTLLERRLVTITGRAEELGRPMLYGTTRSFLETFGLASLKDLPPPEEFGLGPATNA